MTIPATGRLLCSAGIPAIYVNDNFGQWRSDAKSLIARCVDSSCAGKPFVEQLRPDDEDYLHLKPVHSAFQTPLEILFQYLGATTLILTGHATNSCIICTALDANMRNFGPYVPFDGSAARSRHEHTRAIEYIKEMTCASVILSARLRVDASRAANDKTKA